jgi:hypothetical protein
VSHDLIAYPCPDWCETAGESAHRWRDTGDHMSRMHCRRFGQVSVFLQERLIGNGATSTVGHAFIDLRAVVDDQVESFAADIQAAQTLLNQMNADVRA